MTGAERIAAIRASLAAVEDQLRRLAREHEADHIASALTARTDASLGVLLDQVDMLAGHLRDRER